MHLDNEEDEEYRLTLSRFESMLKTNKVLFFDSEEFENIILHYLDSGKLNLAKKALKLGCSQHPNSVGLKLVEVEILIFEHKYDQVDRLLNEIQEIDPTNEEIYIQRATVLSKKGQHQEAIASLEIALTLSQDLADVYSLIAMEYLLLDEIQKAKENFILCLEKDQEDQSALYNIIYCFDFLSETQEAIDFLTQYIDKKPYSEIAWHQLGREYSTLKDYDKAVWAFEYATLIDEYFLGAYLEKGKALEKLEKYSEAIESYMTTLELDDATSFVLLRIGNCFEQLNDFPKAYQYYKRAVHEDPLLDKGWIALTDISIKECKYDKALFYLQKAIQIDELNQKYWIRYAVLNKNTLNFQEAAIGYKKAAELGNYLMEHWIEWADTLYILEQYPLAIQKLLQIADFHANTAEVNYRLAALYFILSNNEQAEFYLNKALLQDSSGREILQRIFPNMWDNPFVQNILSKFDNQ